MQEKPEEPNTTRHKASRRIDESSRELSGGP
jgi:hypothetical protein